jgi:hypothetical protein
MLEGSKRVVFEENEFASSLIRHLGKEKKRVDIILLAIAVDILANDRQRNKRKDG